MLRVVGHAATSSRTRTAGPTTRCTFHPLLPPSHIPCLVQPVASASSSSKRSSVPSTSTSSQPLGRSSEPAFESPSMQYLLRNTDRKHPPCKSSKRKGDVKGSVALPDRESHREGLSTGQANLFDLVYLRLRESRGRTSHKTSKDGVKNSEGGRERFTRPLQTFRWVHWLVEQSAPVSTSSIGSYTAEGENDSPSTLPPSPFARSYEYSAPCWGLLLKHAAHHSDGPAFKLIAEHFVRWWERERMLAEQFRTGRGRSGTTAHSASSTDSKPPKLRQGETIREPHHVQRLATALVVKLQSQEVFSQFDADKILRLLGTESNLSPSDDPYVILAGLRTKIGILSERGRRAKRDGVPELKSSSKKLSDLSSWKVKDRVRRQIRDYMKLINAHDHGSRLDVAGLRKELTEQGLRSQDSTASSESLTPSSKSRLEGELGKPSEGGEAEIPSEDGWHSSKSGPIAGVLGSLDDPKSIASSLLQKKLLLNMAIARWHRSSSTTSYSTSESQNSASSSSTPSPGPPPAWLILAAFRSLAESGDAVKLKSQMKHYLSDWALQQSALLEGGRRRYFLPPYDTTIKTLKCLTVSQPNDGLEGTHFLDLLIKSHIVSAVDVHSARRAYQHAHADLIELCGNGAKDRLRLSSLPSQAPEVESFEEVPSWSSTQSYPQVAPPFLVPQETTVALFLRLLRLARAPLKQAFELVTWFERGWSPACAIDRINEREVGGERSSSIESSPSPPEHPSDSREQTPRLLLTLQTSYILLDWAISKRSRIGASKAVEIAKEWRYIAREVEEFHDRDRRLRQQRKRRSMGGEQGQERNSPTNVVFVVEGEQEQRSEPVAHHPTATGSSDDIERQIGRRATQYIGMRHPFKEWYKWRKLVRKAIEKGILPPRPSSAATADSSSPSAADKER